MEIETSQKLTERKGKYMALKQETNLLISIWNSEFWKTPFIFQLELGNGNTVFISHMKWECRYICSAC